MFHADGEVATAKAAEKHGVRMALSQLTTSTFEDVREAAPTSAKCLQLYVWRDRALLKEVLDRAKEVGFTSLALTADFSWVGNRERETKTGFTVPPSYSVQQCVDAARSPAWTFDFMSRVPYGYKAVPDADFPAESLVDFIAQQMKPEFDWKDAEWLCQEWGDTGPVALKGVARGEDAKRWLDIGGKVIWVSNHGGRQLEEFGGALRRAARGAQGRRARRRGHHGRRRAPRHRCREGACARCGLRGLRPGLLARPRGGRLRGRRQGAYVIIEGRAPRHGLVGLPHGRRAQS